MSTRSATTIRLRPVPLTQLAPEIVARVRAACEPERIIVYGSYARGEATADSDVDVMVVAKGGRDDPDARRRLYAQMSGLVVPADVLLVSPEELARYGNSIGLVYRPALHEGIVVYEREGALPWDQVSTGVREDGLAYDGEVPADSPEAWLMHARSDLAIASAAIGLKGVLPSAACFHAQQCAEKAMKAVLIGLQIDPPRTHKLAELLPLMLDAGVEVPVTVAEADALSEHAVETRYPIRGPAVTPADAGRAVALATRVLAWAESCVRGLGRPTA